MAAEIVRSLVHGADYELFTADDFQRLSNAGFVDANAYRRAERVGRLEKSLESALASRIQQINALLEAFTPAGRMRRKREDRSSIVEQRYKELQGLYEGKDSSFLWDTGGVYSGLLLPTVNPHESMEDHYSYVGRVGAEKVHNAVLRLKNANRMQVLGAEGSGKSTVMSTEAGFLLGNGKRVVYISATRYIAEPDRILLEALLLAFGKCKAAWEELQDLPTLEDLVGWCVGMSGLIFIIDDWEQLDPKENAKVDGQVLHRLKAELLRASGVSVRITVVSINSPERYEIAKKDKAEDYKLTEEFDGPYTQEELDTWIGEADLPVSALVDLDNLTGGMPRLLRFYAECSGDRLKWLQRVESSYEDKLWTEFVSKLDSKEDLVAALRMVVDDGRLPARLASKVKLTCFYKDFDGRFRLLSPYVRAQTESLLTARGKELDKKLLLSDIDLWAKAVEVECRSELAERNPARIGWHIEGLVMSVIRLQGQLFEYPFKKYTTYAHGQEVAALRKLALEDLREGVLLGPRAFNEKAVDLVWVKLLRSGDYLVVALQLTVAQWKAKEKKRSHTVWKDDVLPEWKKDLGQGAKVDSRFYYAMPDPVKLEDVQVTGLKKLSDVDDSLKWFDQILLKEPTIPSIKAAKRFYWGKEKTCRTSANCKVHFEVNGCGCAGGIVSD